MARKYSVKTIRAIVASFLREFGISDTPVPVEELVRRYGAELRYVPCEDDGLSGMLFRDDDRKIIGINSLHHTNRQRFTIAHELGHLLLHKGKEVHIDRVFRVNLRNAVSSQASDREEIEANRFAAELLMPYDFLMKDVKDGYIDIEDEEEIEELAKKYRVSTQAMTFRLMNILE